MVDDEEQRIVDSLTKVIRAIDAYEKQVALDPIGFPPFDERNPPIPSDLSRKLTRWTFDDTVGIALKHGIRSLGEIVAPHVTMSEFSRMAQAATDRGEDPSISIVTIAAEWRGLTTSDGRTWQ